LIGSSILALDIKLYKKVNNMVQCGRGEAKLFESYAVGIVSANDTTR
jgi:hypothetical protein